MCVCLLVCVCVCLLVLVLESELVCVLIFIWPKYMWYEKPTVNGFFSLLKIKNLN